MDNLPSEPAPGPPPADGDPQVVPVHIRGASRGTRTPLVLAGGLVVVIGVAFALAQLFPPAPESPAIVFPSPRPSASGSPGSTDDATVNLQERLDAAPRLRIADFVERVQDGRLDGYLVYADATLLGWCELGSEPSCRPPTLAIDGLALPVAPAGPPWSGVEPVPDDAMLVLEVRGSGLVYLGSLVATPGGSPSLDAITPASRDPGPAGVHPTLQDVRGWLVVNPVHACVRGTSGTPCPAPPPFLADDAPLPGGILTSDRGQVIGLVEGVWGVEPGDAAVTGGPFLVRPTGGADPAWEVVARYLPSRSVRIVIP